ncbi:hypothetical protein OLX02_04310 [Novosphingobium sp. KCTC 2891]|uniref:hypothetical protein n=1 Tax=Novosphingobium sp. KCTC 2891 TaxID=2989730 RepID=UPI002223BB28|nr:hypothetical protein [Novosphingobium sp. KCTC 2891]MCW1382038.1 hypothetical protein [Novosphingobium sp. KCTC 2891]
MNELNPSATALARRAHVEALLAAYPDVTPPEHGILLQWFRKEASALDVAMMASNPEIARGYRRFREEHIDRFTLADVGKALAFASVVVLLAGLMLFRAF